MFEHNAIQYASSVIEKLMKLFQLL